jgi:hypothetical protein
MHLDIFVTVISRTTPVAFDMLDKAKSKEKSAAQGRVYQIKVETERAEPLQGCGRASLNVTAFT